MVTMESLRSDIISAMDKMIDMTGSQPNVLQYMDNKTGEIIEIDFRKTPLTEKMLRKLMDNFNGESK